MEATRALHEEVGPAATTITAVAERAGVQRLTVYRHFPDDEALILACSSHWQEDHPAPDPSSWSGIADPVARLRGALSEIYAYFRRGAPMLERVLRDEEEVPELAEVMAPWWEFMREVAGGLAAGWAVAGDRQRLVRAAVGHALRFETWRSLSDEGLSDEDAVELMTRMVTAVAPGAAGTGGGGVPSDRRPPVHGVEVDARGRCAHYGSSRDIVSIRFPCCDRWYACHACHEALEDHDAERWPADRFDERAVLCGECGSELAITEYLASPSRCPRCGAPFNPGCVDHHPLYFEVGAGP